MIRFFVTLGRLSPFILAIVVPTFVVVIAINRLFLQAANPAATGRTIFEIKPDTAKTADGLADELKAQGFIRSTFAFKHFLNKLEGVSIAPGEYDLSKSMPPKELVAALTSGKIIERTVVVPAGTTLRELPRILASSGLASEQDISLALRDRNLLVNLAVHGGTLEGYPLPGSYTYKRPITATNLIERLVSEGKKRLEEELPAWQEKASQMGYQPHEVISLASIIEKEAPDIESRKKVSAVYYNRLQIGMPLQSDATLLYERGDFEAKLEEEDIKRPGPYNSYLNTGLPISPICNPSLESIKAALEPENSDALYFFKKPDGSMEFSATFKEHQEKQNKVTADIAAQLLAEE